MIETLLLILATIANGSDVCALGTPVDYYAYTASAPLPPLTLHADDLWIDVYADGVVYLDVDGAIGTDGHPHGECAIQLET